MIIVVAANVINRYCFNRAFFWSAEFSRYITIWSVMLGATALVFSDKHLAISILRDHLHGKALIILLTVNRLLVCVFLGIFVYSGWIFYVLSCNQTCSTMRYLPMNLFYLIMPISGVLMLIGCILRIVNDITASVNGEK